MKKLTLLLILFTLLAACSAPTADIPAASPGPSAEATRTRRPSRTPGPTKTLIPSHTPGPSKTITPLSTISIFAPTFDVRTIGTATLAPQSECPVLNAQAKLQLAKRQDYVMEPNEVEPSILDFLNQGGDVSALFQKVDQEYGRGRIKVGILQDLTNDGVPEIIIRYPGLFIFTCEAGYYRTIFAKGGLASYQIADDLNKNGIPEILESQILFVPESSWLIQEWDGNEFSTIGHVGIGGGNGEIIDVNNDGIVEFVYKGDVPGLCCETEMNPWRIQTKIFSWNGKAFEESYHFFDAPQYRFQAIQDADRETGYGHFEKALELYQEAIFNDKMGWWSAERKRYTDDAIRNRYEHPTPTSVSTPIPDPTEYPRLAAYAYYRMLILHKFLGETEAAQIKYATLQEKFPAESPGYPYVEMAIDFWNAYQSSGLMYDACAAAIAYADAHPEILTPLGSDYHGWQSHIYTPADVCPLR